MADNQSHIIPEVINFHFIFPPTASNPRPHKAPDGMSAAFDALVGSERTYSFRCSQLRALAIDKPHLRGHSTVDFNARDRIRIGPWILQKPAFHTHAQRSGFCIQIEVLVVVPSYVSKGNGLHHNAVRRFDGISKAMVLVRNAFYRLYAAIPHCNNNLLSLWWIVAL